jgi:hypothetical protein
MENNLHVDKKRRLDRNQSIVVESPTTSARALATFLDEEEHETSQTMQVMRNTRPMSGLIQRIMAYLFQRAQKDGSQK